MSSITDFFSNIFFSGLSLAFRFSLSFFILPYIAATKKNLKSSLDSILFLFLGRMFFLLFFGLFVSIYPDFVDYLYFNSKNLVYMNFLFGFILFFIGIMLIFSGIKRYKLFDYFYKYDKFFIFLVGIIIGMIPNVVTKSFFSGLIVNVENYVLSFLSTFLFCVFSFLSPMILLAILSGFISYKIHEKNVFLYSTLQKICGAVIIYLGFKIVLEGWLLFNV